MDVFLATFAFAGAEEAATVAGCGFVDDVGRWLERGGKGAGEAGGLGVGVKVFEGGVDGVKTDAALSGWVVRSLAVLVWLWLWL